MKINRTVGLLLIVAIALTALAAYFWNARSETRERTYNLSEFGIALLIPGSLSDLSHTPQTQQGVNTVLHMTVKKDCEIGVLYQIQKDAIAESRTAWTEETLESAAQPQGDRPAQVKEFTDFYLVFEPSEAPCSENESTIAQEEQMRLDLWNALTTARYMN